MQFVSKQLYDSQLFYNNFSLDLELCMSVIAFYNYRPSGQHTKNCANVTKHCKEGDAGKQVAIILT